MAHKSDFIELNEKNRNWEQKFEAIQYFLRTFAINYGASLIFTSCKSQNNLVLLYEFILHKLYNFPLLHKADPNNRENIFIPVGSDDLKVTKYL